MPFAPQTAASEVNDREAHEICWYRNVIELEQGIEEDTQEYLLHFGAVDYEATVWVEGTQVKKAASRRLRASTKSLCFLCRWATTSVVTSASLCLFCPWKTSSM